MPLIHHLALDSAWTEARRAGTYTVSTLGLDLSDVGFIHCSRPEQVEGVHERYYGDVSEKVLLLTIDTELLTSEWRYDAVAGQPLTFPHIYGPLNADAVVKVEDFRP